MRTLITLLALSLATGALAEEAKPGAMSKFKTFFQNLKEGLTTSSTSGLRQKNVRVGAVAAVRGSAQETADLDKPSWKTGSAAKKSKAARQQKADFSAAVDLAMEGKYAEADEKLAAFEKNYPDSDLLADVKNARVKIKEAQAAAPAEVAPAPAAAAAAAPAAPAAAPAAPAATTSSEAKH